MPDLAQRPTVTDAHPIPLLDALFVVATDESLIRRCAARVLAPAMLAVAATAIWWSVAPRLDVDPSAPGWVLLGSLAWILLSVATMHVLRPLVNAPARVLVSMTAACGVLTWVSQGQEFPVALHSMGKVGCAACLGLLLATSVERMTWAVPIAVVATASDLWSVYSSSGITNQAIAAGSGAASVVYTVLMVPVPLIGTHQTGGLGSVDIVMVGVFIGMARLSRFGVWRTFAAMICGLGVCNLIVASTGTGLPAIPFLAAAFLVFNARALRSAARPRPILVS